LRKGRSGKRQSARSGQADRIAAWDLAGELHEAGPSMTKRIF
jgi:hypothetical protein